MVKDIDRQEINVGFENLKGLTIGQIQQIENDYSDDEKDYTNYENPNTDENHL